MQNYIIERRNAWGREVWAVLKITERYRTVARCDSREDAQAVCNALNSTR